MSEQAGKDHFVASWSACVINILESDIDTSVELLKMYRHSIMALDFVETKHAFQERLRNRSFRQQLDKKTDYRYLEDDDFCRRQLAEVLVDHAG